MLKFIVLFDIHGGQIMYRRSLSFAVYNSPRARSFGRSNNNDEVYVFLVGHVSERKVPLVYLSRPWNARALLLVSLLQHKLCLQAQSQISPFLDWFEEKKTAAEYESIQQPELDFFFWLALSLGFHTFGNRFPDSTL